MLTLIETEKNEAESIVQYLKVQNYRFIDVWYHAFSEEAARHIYENYLLKVPGPVYLTFISLKVFLY